jgi:hypothetical protein
MWLLSEIAGVAVWKFVVIFSTVLLLICRWSFQLLKRTSPPFTPKPKVSSLLSESIRKEIEQAQRTMVFGDTLTITLSLKPANLGWCRVTFTPDGALKFAGDVDNMDTMYGGAGFLATVITRHTSPPRSLRIFPPAHLSRSWVELDDEETIDKFLAMAALLGDGEDIGEEIQRLFFLLQPVAKS